jgi:hypothetical protein
MPRTPSDAVTRTEDGSITVDSIAIAPNSCYYAGETKLGSPPGATVVANAILITQEMAVRSGVGCAPILMPVEFTLTTGLIGDPKAIVIYSVNARTKAVTARALAIPNK